MTQQYRVEKTLGYIFIKAEMEYDHSRVLNLVNDIANLCIEHNINRLLIDATIFSNVSQINRYELGDVISKAWKIIRVAVILRPELINKLFENVATNRGGIVFVTDSMDEAVKWLQQK
jgi:hypothetical protein